MDDAVRTIEAQVAMLLRLSDRTRRSATRRSGELERSAYLVLGVLVEGGAASVNAIADALRLDPSTVTRQVLAMEQAGHVTRGTDPADGRVTVVAATPEGWPPSGAPGTSAPGCTGRSSRRGRTATAPTWPGCSRG